MRSIARGPRDLGGGTYTPAGWYPELQDAARRMLDALDARAAWHDRNGWPGP